MSKPILLTTFYSVLFFLAAFLTLKDYGISWDETIHFRRGEAYVHYFLTGNKTYQDLPKIDLQGTEGRSENISKPRRSFYQNDYHNGEFWETRDIGHPPLSDHLAAFFNVVFFQKLGILDDITSFHLYNILAGTFIVLIVTFFAIETFGKFTSLITFLVLVTYPLFWAETHFNMKDVAQAAFFSAFIFCIYKAQSPNKNWFLISAIFFGMALGTKFNILFAPLIVLPYFFIRFFRKKINLKSNYFFILLVWVSIVVLIFVGSWPFLWHNPDNIFKIFEYYRNIGTGTNYQPDQFFWLGINTFPLQWIFFTTPPLTLILVVIGLFSCWKNRFKFNSVTILWLIWFLAPILRVSMSGASIYGGVRQIFEFIPALALVSGMGAYQIVAWLKLPEARKSAVIIISLSFLWQIQTLIALHPNENVYFNSFIGGLSGARDRNFPSWGNSFGNAYLQGIKWLNENAQPNAKLALVQGTPANAPAVLLRKDINYLYSDTSNDSYFSGDAKEGEYLMELTYNDTYKPDSEIWRYVDKFLIPVYEVKVDGVPILKIWKNDIEHTRLK